MQFKLFGKDKFDQKNFFVENQIDGLLKYFSTQKNTDTVKEAQICDLRKQILKNQKILKKKKEKEKASKNVS